METFLKQTARQILAEHPKDSDKVLVVFNNHRSELFMRRAFEQISADEGRTFFLPQMTVIDDFVVQLGGAKIVQNEFLLFDLYLIHEKVGGPERKYKTFEEFMAFGDIMLSDFSEIDRYCVDAKDLFVNLHDQKAIGEWNVSDPTLSPFQLSYLEFYHSLYDYYSELRSRLEAEHKAYSGMAYRQVAENIATLADGCPYEAIYFVGFNALSACEKRIIKEYSRRGIGKLVVDGDSYYFDDKMQEAGYFLNKHSKEFAEIGHYGPSLFGQGKKEINIVECPEAVLQCKYAGQVLAEHLDWLRDSESTAVVLADESLLIPTLNSLPGKEEDDYKVNVSMGFAYADSGVHLLVQRLLSLYRRASASGYYYADIVEVLADYHIGRLLGRKNMRQAVNDYLDKENRIRCHAAELTALLGGDKLAFLFPDMVPTPADVVELLRLLAKEMVTEGIVESNKKEKQALGGLMEILDYFAELLPVYGSYIGTLDTFERIYVRIAQRHNIAFLGRPLSGLQVLGMLETRNLDFKRVILLSANEGVLPSGRSQNTLIPYDLQRAVGLPTYNEKDSVYAYNFYRLLQRAETIYLVYSAASETMSKGEESRFLKQVCSELVPRFPNIHLDEYIAGTDTALHRSDFVPAGAKTEAVMQRLARIAEKGFSPTGLGVYVECPLHYYYSYILDVCEPDTMQEDLDASQLGTCVHAVMQHIYEPYLGRAVEVDGLKTALADLPNLLEAGFDKFYTHGRSTEGRNRFLYSVAESQVRRALEKEIEVIEGGARIEIVALEQNIVMPLAEGVNLSGYVDRIDLFNGTLRVIDYKTGGVRGEEIAVSRAKLDEGAPMPRKWLQLMCYALTYRHKHPSEEALYTCINALGNLGDYLQMATIDGDAKLFQPDLDDFRERIAALTAEIMNPDIPFEAAPADQNCCKYCPVGSFCPSRK